MFDFQEDGDTDFFANLSQSTQSSSLMNPAQQQEQAAAASTAEAESQQTEQSHQSREESVEAPPEAADSASSAAEADANPIAEEAEQEKPAETVTEAASEEETVKTDEKEKAVEEEEVVSAEEKAPAEEIKSEEAPAAAKASDETEKKTDSEPQFFQSFGDDDDDFLAAISQNSKSSSSSRDQLSRSSSFEPATTFQQTPSAPAQAPAYRPSLSSVPTVPIPGVPSTAAMPQQRHVLTSPQQQQRSTTPSMFVPSTSPKTRMAPAPSGQSLAALYGAPVIPGASSTSSVAATRSVSPAKSSAMFIPTPTSPPVIPRQAAPQQQGVHRTASSAFIPTSPNAIVPRHVNTDNSNSNGHIRSSSMFLPTSPSMFVPQPPSRTPPPTMNAGPSAAAQTSVRPTSPAVMPMPVAIPSLTPQPPIPQQTPPPQQQQQQQLQPAEPEVQPAPVVQEKPSASSLFASKAVQQTPSAVSPSRSSVRRSQQVMPATNFAPSAQPGMFVPGLSPPITKQRSEPSFTHTVPRPPVAVPFVPTQIVFPPSQPVEDGSTKLAGPMESPSGSHSSMQTFMPASLSQTEPSFSQDLGGEKEVSEEVTQPQVHEPTPVQPVATMIPQQQRVMQPAPVAAAVSPVAMPFMPSFSPVVMPATKPFMPNTLSMSAGAVPVYHSQQSQSVNVFPTSISTPDDSPERPPHPVACIGFGGRLVSFFPSRGFGTTSTMYIHGTLANVVPDHPTVSQFKRFPGPLAKASHDAVMRFTKDEAERAMNCEPGAEPQKEKVELSLMWKVINLLCKYYGSLDGNSESAQELSSMLFVYSSRDNSGRTMKPQCETIDPSVFDELRTLLCSGSKVEALRCAQTHGYWPFAMALAQQISPKCFCETTAAFAKACLPDGDPLKSFVMMSAVPPAEVVRAPGVIDRWLENLSMFLVNKSQSTRALVGEMGDKLWLSRSTVSAAHVCYLIAGTAFGFVDNPNTRLVLIGGDHKRGLDQFINPATIQATECFEYAKQQGNPQFTLATFQVYKFIYAQMLADIGLIAEADRYMRCLKDSLRNISRDVGPLVLQQMSEFQSRLSSYMKDVSGSGGNATGAASGGGGGFFSSLASRLFGDSSSSSSSSSSARDAPVTPTAVTPAVEPKSHEAAEKDDSKNVKDDARKRPQSPQTPGWLSRLWGRKVMHLEEDEELVYEESVRRWVTVAEREAIRNGTAPKELTQSASQRFLAASASIKPAQPSTPTSPSGDGSTPSNDPAVPASTSPSLVQPASPAPAVTPTTPMGGGGASSAGGMMAPPSRRRSHRPSYTPTSPIRTAAGGANFGVTSQRGSFTPAMPMTPPPASSASSTAATTPAPMAPSPFFVPSGPVSSSDATTASNSSSSGNTSGNPYAQFFAAAPPPVASTETEEESESTASSTKSSFVSKSRSHDEEEEEYDPFA